MLHIWMFWAIAGCGSPPVEGSLTDGITGAPLADFRLLARASGEVSPTCAVVESSSGSDGRFQFTGLCVANSGYDISPVEDDWWFPDGASIAQGGGTMLVLSAWHAPSGSGLYHLSGGALQYLKTTGDLKKDTVFETEKTFYYPSEIPTKVPVVASSDHLVLAGDNATGTLFYPLHPYSEAIKVKSSRGGSATLRNVSTIGAKFSGPTEYQDSAARSPDGSKVIVKKSADRAATYVAGDALPAGRYAVFKERARRLFIVDFGAAEVAPIVDAADE